MEIKIFMEENEKHSVHYSSNSQTWNTPKKLFDELNEHWHFTLDVACLETSALCNKFFTPEDDGLMQDWGDNVCWCNPPYDDIKSWMLKCSKEFQKGSTVMALIPSRTDTKAFHRYIFPKCTAICFIEGRLKFADPTQRETSTNSAPFPSCLVIYDLDLTDEKIEYLKTLGAVVYSTDKEIDDNL